MLPKVPDHESNTHLHEGNDKHEKGGWKIALSHEVYESVIQKLRQRSLGRKTVLALTDKVHGQLDPDEGKETTDIEQKVAQRVALVAEGRGKVFRPVVLDVMMLYVVVVVGIPGVAHQRLEDVGPDMVEPGVFFGQETTIVDMVM